MNRRAAVLLLAVQAGLAQDASLEDIFLTVTARGDQAGS